MLSLLTVATLWSLLKAPWHSEYMASSSVQGKRRGGSLSIEEAEVVWQKWCGWGAVNCPLHAEAKHHSGQMSGYSHMATIPGCHVPI